MGRLEGKVAIVTGAGSGIGRGLALRFAAEGARVLAADITGAEEETARLAQGGAVRPFRCDVADPARVEAMIAEAVSCFGRLDVLCNNAGIGPPLKLLHDVTLEEWDRVMSINLRGVFLGMKFGIAQMLKNGGGSIINTASIGGVLAVPLIAPYASAKGGVVMLTRQAALDYATRNIRVNALCPGTVETPMMQQAPAEARARMMEKVPLGRLATIEDVTAIAVFLASDESAYYTGQTYLIDGGRSIQ